VTALSARVHVLRRSRTLGQTAVFTASNVAVSGLGALATVLIARSMSPNSLGTYSFAASFLMFTAMFFEFGLFVPASRLAARSEFESTKRVIIGAALVAYVPVAAAYMVAVFGLSFLVDDVFAVQAGTAIREVAAISWGLPFVFVASQLAQGVDRLHVSSLGSLLTQLVFVLGLVAALGAGIALGVSTALDLRVAAFSLVAIAIALWLRPTFRGASSTVVTLVHEARAYGLQIYFGRLISTGTYNMDVLMLGALSNPRSVGLYVLAGSIAYVVGLPAMGLASAGFPEMVNERRINRQWLVWSWVVGGAAALVIALVAEPVIRLVFGVDYIGAAALVLPLALAQAIRGVTALYNSFLSAHAQGHDLRSAALVLALSNIVLNVALIPPFGAAGAAWASLLALLANFVAHVTFYRRGVRLALP